MPHTPIPSDRVMKISPQGDITYEKRCLKQIAGSYDSSISIVSAGDLQPGFASEVYISGNPSKFLQGHNIFGSDDLHSLIADTLGVISKYIDLPINQYSLNDRDTRLTRVDVNYSYELNSLSDVLAWIGSAAISSNSRHGGAVKKGSTVYWGKGSKRWQMKAYAKGKEISVRKHKLPFELLDTPLYQWAQNKLRIELTLVTKELQKLDLRSPSNWNKSTPQQLFDDYITRINMNQQVALTDKKVLELPQALKSTYLIWQQGFHVREHIPERTFYRHKKQLIDLHGIDITLPRQSSESNNVVPLIRVLEAKPATIPDWAFDLDLIHHSAA